MEKHLIGLRAQDFHEALKETVSSGPKEAYFGATLLIGKAASLAMHLKGMIYVDDIDALTYAAAELGITRWELRPVLRQLEIVDLVRVITAGETIKRVDIRVPAFRSSYADLGDLWLQSSPSEIEQAGVDLLGRLLIQPLPLDALGNLGLETSRMAILRDVMASGQILRVEPVAGERLVFSPLAVETNPHAYLKWTATYTDQVGDLLRRLSREQGLPTSASGIAENPVLEDAVLTGILQPVRVQGATGEHRFLFAPRGGLAVEERAILEKARAILACVRYGQHFASGHPILYPRAILQQLREFKRFRRGHPDLATQYSLLVEQFIGHPVKEGSSMWNFEIFDTPENMQALDVALDMLELGEAPSAHIHLPAQQALLTPYRYQGPTTTRPRLAREMRGSPSTRADMVEKLANLMRGGGIG